MSGVIIVFIAVLRLKLMNVIPIFVLFFIIFFQIAYILLRNMLKTILIYPEKSTLYIKGNGTGGGFPFDEIKEIVITKEEKGTGTSTRIFYIVSLNTLTKGMKKVFSDRSSSSAHAFAEELSQIISKEVKTLSD
ncbi:hypothetical protein DRQ23_06815 [bacterium]|nr:MAG: hypothetical protein DRQ23_06815 [bacterium]